MNRTAAVRFTMLPVLLAGTGCLVIESDPGPVHTAQESVEAGAAENVSVDIRMGAGELRLEGGGSKLLDATFRYSEAVGRPVVRYELTGFRGRLTVESRKKTPVGGKMTNEWNLRLGSKVPVDLTAHLGAGKTDLDVSSVPLRSLEVHMGVGELELNAAGKYAKDVNMQVHGGVGEARIILPKDFGAVVDARGGIGSINARGLSKRDGRYYNSAYEEGKPAIHMDVRGGVGEITLSVAN
ncbi:MAG: hypothetical protein IT167_32430 [Bryobacterales bacterium]|nr:hypothetical protein [Bryobacterales bacterium]